jgi:hypothetical protein
VERGGGGKEERARTPVLQCCAGARVLAERPSARDRLDLSPVPLKPFFDRSMLADNQEEENSHRGHDGHGARGAARYPAITWLFRS